MGLTVTSYCYVGFQVRESDFWDEVPTTVATCDKGHAQEGSGPFCSLDGTKFEKRPGREASPKFRALVEHFGWEPADTGKRSWLEGYERIYQNLVDDFSNTNRIRIFQVNRNQPIQEVQPVYALATRVSEISGWVKDPPPLVEALDQEWLSREFDIFERARTAAGFGPPVRLYFSLYVC